MKKKIKRRKGPVRSKKVTYDGVTFASGLEKYMYQALKKAKIKAEYEPETFVLQEGFMCDIQCYERQSNGKGDTKTQYLKLMEEAGELGRAILKNDEPEFIDAIGDMVVVLTNLAELSGLTIEECIDSAYDTIAKRKGKMINGTFVKNN